MRQLVSLLAVVALGMCAYKVHTDQVKAAADKAALEAAAAARRAMATPKPKPVPKPAPQQAVALSRVIEPLYNDLFSPLDQNNPADLVPPLEITKERILDVQAHAGAGKQAVYARGVALLDAMIVLAEERTKAIEAVLRAAKGKSPLDGPNSASSSSVFFTQTTLKRWEDVKRAQKPRFDQLFTLLRTAERDWNKVAGKDARVETYDLPDYAPVLVTVEQPVSTSNPLERGAYDQRRVMYPWRSIYYDRYGYPQSR